MCLRIKFCSHQRRAKLLNSWYSNVLIQNNYVLECTNMWDWAAKHSLDIGHLLKGPVHVVRDGFDLQLLVNELVLDLVNPNDM
jgi:hypothetical protein